MEQKLSKSKIIIAILVAVFSLSACTSLKQDNSVVETAAEAETSFEEESVSKEESSSKEVSSTEEAASEDHPEEMEESSTDQINSLTEGYNKVYINEIVQTSELEQIQKMTSEEISEKLQSVDWDNDGINEYWLPGNISYGGMLFDMEGEELTCIYGYGPYGMGWDGMVFVDDAYWIYSASGNRGKWFEFEKYDRNHIKKDVRIYKEEVDDWGQEDATSTYWTGTNDDDLKTISKEEFLKVCDSEDGIISKPLPRNTTYQDKDFSEKLFEKVMLFLEGKGHAFGVACTEVPLETTEISSDSSSDSNEEGSALEDVEKRFGVQVDNQLADFPEEYITILVEDFVEFHQGSKLDKISISNYCKKVDSVDPDNGPAFSFEPVEKIDEADVVSVTYYSGDDTAGGWLLLDTWPNFDFTGYYDYIQ